MKKVISLVVVFLLFFVTFVNIPVKAQYAAELQGLAVPSFDGNAEWFDEVNGTYNGNITTIEIDDLGMSPRGSDDAINTKFGREYEGIDDFSWNAEPSQKEEWEWETMPENKSENIMFLAEYQHYDDQTKQLINYTWASNWHADDFYTPPDLKDQFVRYEPIPKPEPNPVIPDPVGATWINLSIPHFKYTDYNDNMQEPNHFGTFDLFQSYAVFMKEEGGQEWRYLGNSYPDPKNPQVDPPIPAYRNDTHPAEVNTGADCFNVTGLKPDTHYNFLVRVNFRTLDAPNLGPVWGYRGGLGGKLEPEEGVDPINGPDGGSITPFSSSGSGGWLPTDGDDTPPNVTITSPSDGEYISSTSVDVQWTGSDSQSGIDHYETRLDGGAWIDKGTSTHHTYNSLSQSWHTVDVMAYDNAGNSNTTSVSFHIDTIDPTVNISSPPDGEVLSSADVTIEWNGSDSGSGIYSYYVRLDGGSWTNKGSSTNHTYHSLSEGNHTSDVWVYDMAYNSHMDTVNFQVDTIPPTVNITAPGDGDVFEVSEVTIEWSGSDSGSGVYGYWVRIDGGGWTNKGMSTSHTYHSLTKGNHTVDVWIYDNAFNADMDTVTFEIDPTVHLSLSSSGNANGWNFVSTKLIPNDIDLQWILENPEYGISGNYSKVLWYDGSQGEWRTYVPGRADRYNDLQWWDETRGLWIKMTTNDTLTIKGTEPNSTDITLQPGWNMVGYPSDIVGNNDLPAEVSKIGYFDPDAEYNIAYDHNPASFIFEPGKAYLIYNGEDYAVGWTVDY